MLRYNVTIIGLCFAVLLTGCDSVEHDQVRDLVPSTDEWSLDQSTVLAPDTSEPTNAQVQSGSMEFFYFEAPEDVISITSAPGNLFAPTPAGIPLFTEPELAEGFMVSFKVYDQNHDLVGFGTEQEIVDLPGEIAYTTYTLTLPGRGTLMLKQQEDIGPLLAEVAEMGATQDLVREYNPPWVMLSTIPGTGRIVGGTGEFAHAKGVVREFGVTYGIDLTTQTFDIAVVLQVKYF